MSAHKNLVEALASTREAIDCLRGFVLGDGDGDLSAAIQGVRDALVAVDNVVSAEDIAPADTDEEINAAENLAAALIEIRREWEALAIKTHSRLRGHRDILVALVE